jgi:AcrR family transcriptional regulator
VSEASTTTTSSSGSTRRGRRVPAPPRVSGDERERAILATAEALLAERRLHEISVDDLARGAGISRPTFYFYFASKDAVLLALLDRMVAESHERRGDVMERFDADPHGVLREATAAVYETFRTHRAATLAAADARASSAEIRELWARVMDGFVAETTLVIETERARGNAPPGLDAGALATALNLMNERVMHAALERSQPAVAADEVVDTLVAVWISAIYGANATPPGEGRR